MTNVRPCFHCGLPSTPSLQADINGVEEFFCCLGCQAVAQAIVDGGLSGFYQHRDKASSKATVLTNDYSDFDIDSVQAEFVDVMDNGMTQANIYLGGINCAACVWLIERHLAKFNGIKLVRVNASSHRATIQFKLSVIPLSQIFRALADIGFQPQPLIGQVEQEQWQKHQREQLLRIGVAGIGMMQAGMVAVALYAGDMYGMEAHWQTLLRWVSMLITAPILLYSARPFFSAALNALKSRHLVMDVSVSIALLLAYGASVFATVNQSGEVYFDSISMLTFFLLLGRFIESRARHQNFKSRAQFSRLLPFTVDVAVSGARDLIETQTLPLKELSAGQRLFVHSGDVFPCDGLVVDGRGEADEALLTGESVPCGKSIGDRVYAGTHNGSARLLIEATAVGTKTEFAAIEQLVDKASHERPHQISLVDAIAAKFVAAILIVTLLVASFWLWQDSSRALWITLSVLVVTCPCALSLATPTALAAAINRLRLTGVLVTSANTLENLNKVDWVVFDKTGTLTDGALNIAEVRCLSAIGKEKVLDIAAALEAGSSHPIASAFKKINTSTVVRSRDVKVGQGVSGDIDGVHYRIGEPLFSLNGCGEMNYPSTGLWLLLTGGGQALAWLRLEDNLRLSAKKAIVDFQSQGVQTVLLSGDRSCNVISVAKSLGIEYWLGGMSPSDKLAYVREQQSRGRKVLMIGDGINDLPVLSGADISCAMGSATRLAQTKADCVLLGGDLTALPKAVLLSQQVRRTIIQNLSWAVFYNVCALPLAIMGMIPPWLAAIGMSGSSLIVVLNSLRVGRNT